MKKALQKLGLNPNNSLIVGSGILQALGIRNSQDIDVVASQEIFDHLKKSGNFRVAEDHGREILRNDSFEIGTEWDVLDKPYRFEDFVNDSIVINGVRFITIDFLYKAKKSWVEGNYARPKDIEDVRLIEKYMSELKG
jgi:hypothetical protein